MRTQIFIYMNTRYFLKDDLRVRNLKCRNIIPILNGAREDCLRFVREPFEGIEFGVAVLSSL